jgi:tetratricopeptide (TPR) repeat protein
LKYYLPLCWLLLAGSLWGCLEAIRRSPPDQLAPVWMAARPDSGAILPVKRLPAPPPSGKRRATAGAKQVNEYAFWCIGKGLWQEARLHLEQAAQRDSLTGSYHNNLAIIYEHLGLEEQAAAAYQRAQILRPDQKAYLANIRHFEGRQRAAHPDSAAAPQTDSTQTDQQPPTGE